MKMNDDTESIESLLRGLSPAAPNPELRERVAADLKLDEAWLPRQVRRAPRWVVATGWAGLGAAAAVAVMGMVMRDFAPATPTSQNVAERSAHKPDQAAEGTVGSVKDEAWVDANAEAVSRLETKTAPKSVLPVNFQ